MTRRPPGSRALLALVLVLLSAPTALRAQYNEPPAPAAYALKNVTVVHADATRQTGVNLVVRGAFIEAIGAGVAIPPDAQLLEGDSLVVYPGIVDAQGTAKYEFPKREIDRSKIPTWNAPRWVQGFTPHRRVVDHLTATGGDLADQRKKGVVAAAVYPSDALMPGRGTLLLFRRHAADPTDLVVEPVLGPVLTFRGVRGFYPATLFGVMATIRQNYMDAARHQRLASAHASDPRGVTDPAFDPDFAVLQETMGGKVPVFTAADDDEEIRRVLRLSEELGIEPVIVGGAEAWEVAGLLKARAVPVLVSLDFPAPKRWKPESEKKEGDKAEPKATKTPDAAELREKQRIEAAYANAGKLARAGVRFALTSGGGKADIREAARKAIEHGLSEADALRAVTATPAALLGIPHAIRIEAGLPATFLVATGPLFEKETRVAYTFVEGSMEKGEPEKKKGESEKDGDATAATLAGTWEVEIDAQGQEMPGTLVLEKDGTGSMTTEMGNAKISGVSVDGTEVTFTAAAEMGGQSMDLTFSGNLSGETISGSGESPFGSFTWTAKRKATPNQEMAR